MIHTTLCFLIKGNNICLAMKKRGFGKDRWNGVGGKLERGETIEEAALRELEEEIIVKSSLEKMKKVGFLKFYFDDKPDWNQDMHIYFINEWEGRPIETDEMRPSWYTFDNIPYDKMWIDDIHWLPKVLTGKVIEGEFYLSDEGKSIKKFNLKEI